MLLGSARLLGSPRFPGCRANQLFRCWRGDEQLYGFHEGNHGEFGEITRDYADSFINVITVIINMLYDNTRSFTFVRLTSLNSNE